MRRALLVAAALLLALPATQLAAVAQVPSTQPVRPQLEIASIRLQNGTVPDLRDGVGGKGHVLVTIKNTGQVDVATYTVGYQWQAADGTLTWLNFDDPAASTDTNTNATDAALHEDTPRDGGTLQRGESRDLPPMPWISTLPQAGQGRIVVTITYSEQSTSRIAPDPRNPPYFVAAHDVRLSVPTAPLNLSAQETGFFRVSLRNAGNVDEPVTLNVTNGKVGVNARLSAQWFPNATLLRAGRDLSADLLVRYPFTGERGNFTADFTVRATISPGPHSYNKTVLAALPSVRARDCCAPTGHAFSAEDLAPSLLAVPGRELRVPVRITNAALPGSRLNDTYQVLPVPPDGWASAVDPPHLALVAGESRTVNVDFIVPDDAPKGATFTLPIRVRSDHLFQAGGATTDRLLQNEVQVRGAALVVQALAIDSRWLYKGDEARGVAWVANVGTERYDDPSLLHVDAALPLLSNGERGSMEFDVSVPPAAVGETVEVPFTLGRLTGTGAVQVKAAWREAGGVAGGSPLQAEEQAKVYNLTVRAPPPLFGQPGETVFYQSRAHAFNLTNRGTATERVRIAAGAPGSHVTLARFEVELEPGRGISIPLAQTLPRPAGNASRVVLTLAVAPPERPDLVRSASVATGIVDRLPPQIRPEPLPANWTVAQPLPVRLRVQDDGAVAAVEMAVRLPPANFTPVPLQLGPGGNWTGQVPFLSEGDHEVRFTARDAAGNVATTQAVRVHVEDYTPPRLELVAAPQGPTTRAAVVHLVVSGVHPLASLTARVGAGNATALAVHNGTAELRLADLPGLQAGRQEITVEAVDSVGAHATLVIPVELQEAAPTAPAATTTARASPSAGLAAGLLGVAAAAMARRAARRR